MRGRRFAFACFTILCVSVTCVWMEYSADVYKFMILAIVGGYLGVQSVTNLKKINGGRP